MKARKQIFILIGCYAFLLFGALLLAKRAGADAQAFGTSFVAFNALLSVSPPPDLNYEMNAVPSTNYPTTTPVPVNILYQSFESGYMVMAEDGLCVYVFAFGIEEQPGYIIIPADAGEEGLRHDYYYCLETAGLPDTPPIIPALDGRIIPTGAFGQVWEAYEEVRSTLGYATEPLNRFTGSLPPLPNTFGGGPWSIPVIPLPDDKALWCGFRAATAHTCYIG